MLGNWSFGDYYKKEAIDWAWDLLTNVWKLDINRIHATVYRTDDEAFEIWKNYLPINRIHRFDEKDNFWEMGETGPCGPCSEIHYDRTSDFSGGPLVNAGSPNVIEIWNLVFIQYNRNTSGELEPLGSRHVDTGMGFERICAVIQNKNSNYETDVFMPLINKIAELSKKPYKSDIDHKDSIAMRVIADHIRTLTFAIADGAIPGNDGRGYVLRRILRRGARFARNLGFNEPVMYKLIPVIIENFGIIFPEIVSNRELITKIVMSEEESFLTTLGRGLEKFEEIANVNSRVISGEDAFLLYDSFGFPLDLTELIARERNLSVDIDSFNQLMKEQKNRSRASRKSISFESVLPQLNLNTTFVGYDTNSSEAKIIYFNDNLLVTDYTPFYAESGGQMADTGIIVIDGAEYEVLDVKKSGDTFFHICDREISAQSDVAFMKIDMERRTKIMRNHSATHLLHEALRNVLGNHVQQAGSLVSPDYLRFDFNHFEKPSNEQLNEIERMVNSKVFQNVEVSTQVMPIKDAQKNSKVKMFFGDKYGEVVRLVTMDPKYSMELCGGTHVSSTSEIGIFKITSESSIAAGVRRIEAITANGVENYIGELNHKINERETEIEILNNKIRLVEKELNEIKLGHLFEIITNKIKNVSTTGNFKIFSYEISDISIENMRDLADNIRNKISTSLVLLLAAKSEDKVHLVCAVTDDLKSKYPAGKLISKVAQLIGGNGGGKPHLATAGGKEIGKLPVLLSNFEQIVIQF